MHILDLIKCYGKNKINLYKKRKNSKNMLSIISIYVCDRFIR